MDLIEDDQAAPAWMPADRQMVQAAARFST